METKTSREKDAPVLAGLLKNKYALIVLVLGLVLLLLPTGTGSTKKTETKEVQAPAFSIVEEEKRLANELTRIENVGRVSVLLSAEGSCERTLAQSENKTLVVSENGSEQVVDLYYVNPTYKGAVVVCDGGDNAAARLAVVNAVKAYTGLSADRITVMKMR